NLLRIRRPDVDEMPNARPFEHHDPNLASLLPKLDLGPGDGALVGFSRQRYAHVLVAVLEDAHYDRVLLPREMEQEVFTGQLDLVDRYLPGVEENVVREEVRQHRKPTGAFDAERRRAGDRLRLDGWIGLLEAKARGAGLRRYFEGDCTAAVFR